MHAAYDRFMPCRYPMSAAPMIGQIAKLPRRVPTITMTIARNIRPHTTMTMAPTTYSNPTA
jgi:hypothetical protein